VYQTDVRTNYWFFIAAERLATLELNVLAALQCSQLLHGRRKNNDMEVNLRPACSKHDVRKTLRFGDGLF
jgi:hypothetical protein